MKRAVWSIIGIICVAALLYFVLTHDNVDKVKHLEGELARLEGENRKLGEQNDHLRERVESLRDDPRLAERRAREAGGMARPDEVIYQFEGTKGAEMIEVNLVVGPESCELAGRKTVCGSLDKQLRQLVDEIPNATLAVRFEAGVDAIERQKVKDVVADAKVASRELDAK